LIDGLWAQFQEEAVDLLQRFAQDIGTDRHWVETHLGVGQWTTESTGVTITEESAVVTLYWVPKEWTPELANAEHVSRLAPAVGRLAVRYNQDAIAIVDGRSVLVRGRAWIASAMLEQEGCDHEYEAYCPDCGIDSEEVAR